MSYGLNVYCNGIKLLSTAQMGVAFDMAKNGDELRRADGFNRYSQVEFPLSPLVGWWGTSLDEVVRQFDQLPPSPVNPFGNNMRHMQNIIRNSAHNTRVDYDNGHIVRSQVRTLGLSNTVHSPAQGLPPVKRGRYGLFAKDSLVGLAAQMPHLRLTAHETHRSKRIRKARMYSHIPDDIAQPHIVYVPCDPDAEVLAVHPQGHADDVCVTLYAQTRHACIYLCYSDAEYIDLTVQRYRADAHTPIYRHYGLRLRDETGRIRFTTENPPMLPLFVATAAELDGVPPSDYPLSVVFSRVDSFVSEGGGDMLFAGTGAICNGVRWHSRNQIKPELMGLFGSWSDTRHARGTFYLGAITRAWYERGRVRYRQNGRLDEFNIGLHSIIKAGTVSEERILGSGAFLAVAAYTPPA